MGDDRRSLYRYKKDKKVDIKETFNKFVETLNEKTKDAHVIFSPVPQRPSAMKPAKFLARGSGVWLQDDKPKYKGKLVQHMLAQIFIAKAKTWYHFVDKVGISSIEESQAPIYEDLAFTHIAHEHGIKLAIWYRGKRVCPYPGRGDTCTIARKVKNLNTFSDKDQIRLKYVMEMLVKDCTKEDGELTSIIVKQGAFQTKLTMQGSEAHLHLYSDYLKELEEKEAISQSSGTKTKDDTKE